MAGVAKILDEKYLKLEQELDLLTIFAEKMRSIYTFSKEENYAQSIEVTDFIDRFIDCNKKQLTMRRKDVAILKQVIKVRKKVSPTPHDIASLTQRIEDVTEMGKTLNQQTEGLLEEAKIYQKVYLATKK